jgi:hypothetical protein
MKRRSPINQGVLSLPLGRVRPNQTLLFGAMRCEQIAAEIRNHTVDSMEKEDIADVGYRLLQTRRGSFNCIKEASAWSSCTALIFAYGLIYEDSARFLLSLSLVLSILHVPPNIGNAILYARTNKACDEWLLQRLKTNDVTTIKSISFNQQGMRELIGFFKQEKINTNSIEHRANKEDTFCSFWAMGR